MRLFFAVWPLLKVRERLASIRDAVVCPSARAVVTEDLHLTLAFVGDVPSSQMPALESAAQSVECRPCEVVLDEFRMFSNALVLLARDVPAELQAQRDQLCDLVAQHTARTPDSHPFHPHVTLLRRVRKPPRLPPPPKLRFVVSGFALAHSDLGATGAHYQIISQYKPAYP